MRVRALALLLATASLAVTSFADGVPEFTPAEKRVLATFSPLGSPPPDPTNRHADSDAAAAFGKLLFEDEGLSPSGELSCLTCHDPERGLADGLPLAQGLGQTSRHSPSLWNVAFSRWYFWDGRVDTLWGQAIQPLEHPKEMGSDRLFIAHHVAKDQALRSHYEALFGALPELGEAGRFPARAKPDPGAPTGAMATAWKGMAEEDRRAINELVANLGKALAAHQRRFVTGRTPFDDFVASQQQSDAPGSSTMSASAQRGLKLFLGKANCRSCHFGPTFSDGEFHDTRVPPLGGGPAKDSGRYGGLAKLGKELFRAGGEFSDAPDGVAASISAGVLRSGRNWGEFKTPGLRNVAASAPYMHQGQLATLEDVVHYYSTLEGALPLGHHGESILRPLELSETEEADLVAFLRSLTTQDP